MTWFIISHCLYMYVGAPLSRLHMVLRTGPVHVIILSRLRTQQNALHLWGRGAGLRYLVPRLRCTQVPHANQPQCLNVAKHASREGTVLLVFHCLICRERELTKSLCILPCGFRKFEVQLCSHRRLLTAPVHV